MYRNNCQAFSWKQPHVLDAYIIVRNQSTVLPVVNLKTSSFYWLNKLCSSISHLLKKIFNTVVYSELSISHLFYAVEHWLKITVLLISPVCRFVLIKFDEPFRKISWSGAGSYACQQPIHNWT